MIDLRINRNRIYMFAYNLQEKKQFESFMVACILINTLLLSLDRFPENPDEVKVMEKINIVFTGIFTLEMIIKLLALGFKNYFRSMFNIFDCMVVISGFIDIFLATFLV